MTGVYQNDDKKKQRMLEITNIILEAMEYKRKLTIRQNRFIKESRDAVDCEKPTASSEELE